MNTIFDKTTRNELITRIKALDENSTAQWGKMNLYQMVKHCVLWEEMMSSKLQCKRMLLGRFIGRMALKSALKDDSPMMRNAITSPELIVKEYSGDIASEKKKWISHIEDYAHFSHTDFIHPFFGKMTKEQIGYHAFKHTDHHLRQFNS